MAALAARGGADIPVVVGGIVPKADVPRLTELGVRAVFTPADFDLAAVLARMAELIGGSAAA
jgi:(2R)-ethylmalonyl-CoA mutase